MFTLYSISKAFCAIGLMKLADKGLIDINRHPGVYLQEAKDFPKELTIRHLLWHGSAIYKHKLYYLCAYCRKCFRHEIR